MKFIYAEQEIFPDGEIKHLSLRLIQHAVKPLFIAARESQKIQVKALMDKYRPGGIVLGWWELPKYMVGNKIMIPSIDKIIVSDKTRLHPDVIKIFDRMNHECEVA